MKSLTADQVQSRQDRAVRFVEDVLGDPDKAAEIEDEDLEDYAARRKISIANSGRRSTEKNLANANGRSKEDLLNEIADLEAENQDLRDRLDAIGDLAAASAMKKRTSTPHTTTTKIDERVEAVGHPAESKQTRSFTSSGFTQILRASEFVAVTSFWRHIERLAEPELRTCLHALGFLRELAKRAFADCDGWALSVESGPLGQLT